MERHRPRRWLAAFGLSACLAGPALAAAAYLFALAREPAREVAAEQINAQVPDTDVGPGDVTLTETGDGFEATFGGSS